MKSSIVRPLPALHSARLLEQLRERFRYLLCIDLPWMQKIGRPKARARLPVVLAHEEVRTCSHCSKASTGCWRNCSMAPACASTKACSCA